MHIFYALYLPLKACGFTAENGGGVKRQMVPTSYKFWTTLVYYNSKLLLLRYFGVHLYFMAITVGGYQQT